MCVEYNMATEIVSLVVSDIFIWYYNPLILNNNCIVEMSQN